MKRLSRQRGMTLLEILVAFTISALLLGLCFQSVRNSTKSVQSGEKVAESIGRVRTAQQFMRRQLGNALPFAYAQQSDGQTVVFEGERDEVRFVAAMPGHQAKGGAYVQVLEINNTGDGEEILFKHRLLNGFDVEGEMSDDDNPAIVLLDGLEDCEFEYLTMDDQGKPEDWENNWEKRAVLPLAIRLTCTFKNGQQLQFPELLVAMRIDPAAGYSRVNGTLKMVP
jgi:general secretion pathway protein J